MRNVLLVIRADFGTYLAVDMPLQEAIDIVSKHRKGELPPIIGGILPNGGCWSFESKRITLLHTQELEPVAKQSQGTFPYNLRNKISGYQH